MKNKHPKYFVSLGGAYFNNVIYKEESEDCILCFIERKCSKLNNTRGFYNYLRDPDIFREISAAEASLII